MADLQICAGPVGMLIECEHGQRGEHGFLQGNCNRCGKLVTVVTGRYGSNAEVKGFRCRDCMKATLGS